MNAWLLWITLLSPDPSDAAIRGQMVRAIQSAILAKPASIWDITDPGQEIVLTWQNEKFQQPITYSRRVLDSPDGGFTLLEVWQIEPDDLVLLCKIWGHPDRVAEEVLLNQIPNGRIIFDPLLGKLLIFRDFPRNRDIWEQPPFRLDKLPTLDFPGTPQPVDGVEGEARTKDESAFAVFLADIVNEELLDRDGVPITASKTWEFSGQFSRLSPRLRLERRIQLDFDRNYSVYDILSFELEVLLGDREIREEENFSSEAGTLFEAEKKIVIIRHGLRNWYDAVFAPIFKLKDLPYTPEKLAALPIGVRVMLPSNAGISLVERLRQNDPFGEQFPLRFTTFAGIRGTFFVSVVKRTNQRIDLRFGARIERPLFVEFRVRPDFDGPFDPLRLLMGTVIQKRWERIYGSRLFLRREMDLDDPAEVGATIEALEKGIRLNSLLLGTTAMLNFSFSPRIDQRLMERFTLNKLSDIDWEQRVQSAYKEQQDYAKLGFRPVSFRAATRHIEDDWRVLDLVSGNEETGRSGSFDYQRTLRFFNYINKREIQVLALQDDQVAPGSQGHGHYMQLIHYHRKSKVDRKNYRRLTDLYRYSLGSNEALRDGGSLPPPDDYRDFEIGYRLILAREALPMIGRRLVEAKRLKDSSHPLKYWLAYHPILIRRLAKHMDDSEQRDFLVSKLIFKMAKSRGPIELLLHELPESAYTLEYRESSQGNSFNEGKVGSATLPRQIYEARRLWEELALFDDVFVDRDFRPSIR